MIHLAAEGLYDSNSAISALIQRCMAWAVDSNEKRQLLLGTRTLSSPRSSISSVHSRSSPSGGCSRISDTNSNSEQQSFKKRGRRRRNLNKNDQNIGMLLPMGFGDASTGNEHPLDNVEQSIKREFLSDLEKTTTHTEYNEFLHKYRSLLMNLILPNSRPTTEEQAHKDAVRELFLLNGVRIEGHKSKEMMRMLHQMISPFAFSNEAIERTSLDVLRAASRTCTGGDSYFLTSSLFGRPGVMVTAGQQQNKPITISSTHRGQIAIRSYNIYDIHDEDALMNEEVDDPIISLTTETVETIDCISGRANRVLQITSNDIERLVLMYRVKGAGIPGANGKYIRQGVQRLYANMNGYFLEYQEIKEKNMGGGRMQLEEYQWTISRTKEQLFYVCSVTKLEEAPRSGWVAVKNGGVLPNPFVHIVSRGYHFVPKDEIDSIFVSKNGSGNNTFENREEDVNRKQRGNSAENHSDLLTGVSPPRPTIIENDVKVVSPGISELVSREENVLVLGGTDLNSSEKRRKSVILQNTAIMTARDASRRRREKSLE